MATSCSTIQKINNWWFGMREVAAERAIIFFDLWLVAVFNCVLHTALHINVKYSMNHFRPVRTKAKFTPPFYYKITITNIIRMY
jgi:hypothetical protein